MQIIQDSLDLYYDIQNSKPTIQIFEYATIVFHKISYSITKSIWKTYLKTLINMDWFVNQTKCIDKVNGENNLRGNHSTYLYYWCIYYL